jgi:hypothetical protein
LFKLVEFTDQSRIPRLQWILVASGSRFDVPALRTALRETSGNSFAAVCADVVASGYKDL